MPSKSEDIITKSDEYGAYTGLGLPLTLRTLREGAASLSEPERHFLGVYQLHTNVNNGGFYGFFTNASGDFAVAALAGLEAVGAPHIHSLLARACSVFPSGVVPATQGEREVLLQDSSGGDKWADLDKPNRFQQFFEPLDREFYSSPERLCALAVAYARAHIADFRVD
jgi:hypothetical protein